MIDFWSYPMEDTYVEIPAEFKFILRYLKIKGYKDVEITYEWMSKVFGFYIKYCRETSNPLTSLKRHWNTDDLMNSHDVIWK